MHKPTDLPTADAVQLTALAHQRLATVVHEAETTSTLDEVLRRLFDRDERELLTYSAFGSAL